MPLKFDNILQISFSGVIMKAARLPYAFALVLLLSGCNSNPNDDIVEERYVHRYGVPMDPDDWSERGRQGQIVATRNDGVTVTNTYDAGVLDGETTFTYPHRNTIQKREIYSKGYLKEEFWNYSNGLPSKHVIHNSPTNYISIVWYDNGVPQCRENYDNNLLVQGEYFTPANLQESVVNNQEGTRTLRDCYGALQSIDEIKNGQMTTRNIYHPNGAPQSITSYVNGDEHGQKRTFMPGGDPNTIEQWTKGSQHGPTIVFENGEKVSETPYVNGKKHGIEHRYGEDGKTVVEDVTWVQGQKHGPSYTYVGNSRKIDWYFQDKPVNKATFDALSNQ